MCARRFLLIVTILTLIAVGAAFAIFSWGGDVLLKQATPKGHFEAPPPSSGPDYRNIENWLSWPDPHGSPSQDLPPGLTGPWPEEGGWPAATFYVHPTTYLRRDRWNGPLDDVESAERAELFVRSQATAFNGRSTIWAPKYRQAAYGAFLLDSEDARQALDLAYSDVSAAFDNFLKRVKPGQPLILAGHSQGSLHLMRLLQERKDQLKGRLVAAYVVGWPVSTTADLPELGFPACERPDQNGCILSWMTFAEPANPSLVLDQWRKSKGLNGGNRRREDMICVNPLTGTQGSSAPPAANPGTLVPTPDLQGASLEPGRVGATCDKGLLVLNGDPPALGPYVLPGNNYHVYDYALFWGAIRQDSERRVAAWQR